MIKLNKAKNGIRDDNWPKIIAENTINYEQNTPYQIDNPNFFDVFQDKTQHDEKRCAIADKVGNFRVHSKFLGRQT